MTRIHVLTAAGLIALAAVLVRLAFFDFSPGSEMFHPHGYCYLWQPDLVAAHVISDGLIGLSYVAISLTLVYLVWRAREHLPFSWMFVAFGGFIIACGATHFVEIWTLWQPLFWLAADVKIITAVASVATAVVLPPLVPKVLSVVTAARVSEERRVALERAHAELEGRVAERTAALSAALERAEAASREKEAFLSIVSHELRTPLNAILGWSRMLAKAADPAFVERGLGVIDRNARVQAQLVDDLLDMSRVTAGTLRVRTAPVDLMTAIREAVDVVSPAAEAKSIAIDTTASRPQVTVMADRRRLQQVVWNILSNAVKFTPHGGRVSIRAGVEHDTGFVEVQDTGIGIDPGFMPKLFDRFSQADTSSTRTHQGLGIGLAIARSLMELHGGTLTAHSGGPGTGATFRIALPIVAQPATPGEEDADVAAGVPRLDAVRVLIVDDERDARETVGTILERAGASVTAADSVAAALHRLQSGPFDVLLSDLGMPGEDGFSLLRRLRQSGNERLHRLPAIAVSAYASEEDRARAMAAGFEAHLAKPITPEALIRGVTRVLHREDMQRPPDRDATSRR